MNVEVEYKTIEDYTEAVTTAHTNGWFSDTTEEDTCLLDECDDVIASDILDNKNKTIRINLAYIRNGYKLLDILSKKGSVTGRVTSTDGTFELSMINDNVTTSIEMEDFLKNYSLTLPNSNYDYDNEDEEDAYNEQMDVIFEQMEDWCCEF
jgi:hypothetical protein